jgi:hypothetical protein
MICGYLCKLNIHMIALLELNPTGNYKIDQSAQLVWPFEITRGSAWKFTVAHTSWASNQSSAVRFWVSVQPGGSSVSQWPQGTWQSVIAGRKGQSWIIYDSGQKNWQFEQVVFAWPVVRDRTYWLNVQNRENKLNGFSLHMTQLFRDTPE